MIGKTKIVLSLLVASFMLVGMVSATTCTPESYDSGWLDIVNYIDSTSGTTGIYNGNWYIDNSDGIVTVETPSLPFSETYTLYIKYGIGTGNDLTNEDFQVVCGGDTFQFPDSILIDDPQTLIDSMQCTLNSGNNLFSFESTNTGSIHLFKFKLVGDKTCPPVPYCGDNTQDAGEQCDDGNNVDGDGCSAQCTIEIAPACGDNTQDAGEQCDWGLLNGQTCSPLYGDTCDWCNSQCDLITETGPYCGDGNCELCYGETCSTCEADCGICPPGPTCGDNTQDAGEQCDWGLLNGQTCSPLYGDTCDWCNSQCDLITETGPYCGDTICGAEESCSLCETDCGTCPEEPVCGNDIKEAGEECDDGNNEDDDGCSAECEDEKEHKKRPLVMITCNPDWECSGWSECDGEVMTRNCVDANMCEVQYNEPSEVSACDMIEEVKEPANNNLFWFFLGILLLIILLIILVNLLK
jgi:cysteine-rich repeat protein